MAKMLEEMSLEELRELFPIELTAHRTERDKQCAQMNTGLSSHLEEPAPTGRAHIVTTIAFLNNDSMLY